MADALYRLPRSDDSQNKIFDSPAGDFSSSNPCAYVRPRRPVLDVILPDHLMPADLDAQPSEWFLFALLIHIDDQPVEIRSS